MLQSMTAYGRSTLTKALGRFTAEIQSVNRKHLDIQLMLPKELQRFESDIRKLLTAAITRGQVTLKLFAHFDKKSPISVTPNLALAKEIYAAWTKIASELHLTQSLSVDAIFNQEGILSFEEAMEDEATYRDIVVTVVNDALQKYLAMRVKEGHALHADITARFSHLKQIIDKIEMKAPEATTRFRQKLLERINEVVPGALENEERILREVCVYAEKVDVAEEITRFKSHIVQSEELINSNATHIGKTLEFLLQELGRETNTIGSKCSDLEISKWVIDIKSELERIREQIQNIE